jgi:hypothetical protein
LSSLGSVGSGTSSLAGSEVNSPQKDQKPEASDKSTDDRSTLVEKLRRLGITGDTLAFLEDDREPRDPSSYVEFVQDNVARQDVQTYMAWEKMQKVCLGLNSVVILAGKAELALGFSGLNFVDLFPETKSLQEVKDDIAARRARMARLELKI